MLPKLHTHVSYHIVLAASFVVVHDEVAVALQDGRELLVDRGDAVADSEELVHTHNVVLSV